MTNPDTQNMIDLVERQTGYRVMVDVISGIHDHAQMISARPEAPAHMIRVSADHSTNRQLWEANAASTAPSSKPNLATSTS